jgi:hypothetical protein
MSPGSFGSPREPSSDEWSACETDIRLYLQRKRLVNKLGFEYLGKQSKHTIPAATKIMVPFARRAGLYNPKFRQRLKEYLKSARYVIKLQSKTSNHPITRLKKLRGMRLSNAIERLGRCHLNQLSRYPVSIEKANLLLKMCVDIEDAAEESDFISLGTLIYFKDEPLSNLTNLVDAKLHRSHFGWTSLDLGEMVDTVRFLEAFSPAVARIALRKNLGDLRYHLQEAAKERFSQQRSFALGVALWLLSRAPSIPRLLRPELREALDAVLAIQHPDGWWPERDPSPLPNGQTEEIPDTAATALCAVGIQALGYDRHMAAAARAIQWLITAQQNDGSWCVRSRSNKESDVFTTVVALEAMRRHDDDINRQIELGERWLLNSQKPDGSWNAARTNHYWRDVRDNWPDEWLNVLVLYYFRNRHAIKPVPPGLLTVAKGFIRRAEELALEEGSDVARLAVVSAFHGVEMFLYGVCADALYNLDYFRANSQDTYGLREILGLLRKELRERGQMGPRDDFKGITQIKELAALRDQVVHKGHDVEPATSTRLVGYAVRFVTHYARELLEVDLLD